MNLSDIGREAHDINFNNGWEVFAPTDWPRENDILEQNKVRFLGTHMTLVHEEVSEAFRGVRKRDRANFDEELADVIIRVTSIAYGLGTDLDAAVKAKLVVNAKRGFRHGGKAV